MKSVNKLVMYFEITVLAILVFSLIVLLFNPLNPIRKIFFSLGLVISLVVVYSIRAYIMWSEESDDERSVNYSYKSSWLAYLTGTLFLLAGIIIGAYEGDINQWLIVALAGMFFSKFLSMIYLEKYK